MFGHGLRHVSDTLGGRGKWAAGNTNLEFRGGIQVGDPHKLVGPMTSPHLGRLIISWWQ